MEHRFPQKNIVKTINAIYQDEHADQADAKRVTLVDPFGEDINSSNRLPVDAIISVSSIKTPEIYNILVPVANAEQSLSIPDGTHKLLFRVRETDTKMQFAFSANQSGTNYITIRPGTVYIEENIQTEGLTVYFQLNNANKTVEILTWV